MKININDTKKTTAALDKAQHRCSPRLLEIGDVTGAAKVAEMRLEALNVLLRNRPGCRLLLTHAFGGHVPGSYKGRPEATYVTMERGGKDWFAVDVGRTDATTGTHLYGILIRLFLTDGAKGDILADAADWK